MEKNISKIRAHDAIVGVLYLISVGLTFYSPNFDFLWIAIGVGGLQLSMKIVGLLLWDMGLEWTVLCVLLRRKTIARTFLLILYRNKQ